MNSDREWTEEEARNFGDRRFQFGTNAREGLQEGLTESLATGIKAENDLADYLEKSADSVILVGINAVLSNLVSPRGISSILNSLPIR